ncbi:MAG: hypothetical protein M9927_07715 [Anaerolineae bacterium]|nr:hypothetical protein [Anaerolineae bacterium]
MAGAPAVVSFVGTPQGASTRRALEMYEITPPSIAFFRVLRWTCWHAGGRGHPQVIELGILHSSINTGIAAQGVGESKRTTRCRR